MYDVDLWHNAVAHGYEEGRLSSIPDFGSQTVGQQN